MMTIKVTEQYGRGMYATEDIEAGIPLEVCEVLVLSKEDTVKVNQTELKYYTFAYKQDQDCLVLGNGEIFNHSDEPNTGYKLSRVNKRDVMLFYTLRDVKAGEQLFTDYNADVKVDTEAYKSNKSLI